MSNSIKCVAALLLSTLLCSTASASAYTHFWTIDGTSQGIGLVGIYDGPGEYRTQVNYGSNVIFDRFWIPLHFYVVVAVLNIPVFVFVALYLFPPYHRRHAPSTA